MIFKTSIVLVAVFVSSIQGAKLTPIYSGLANGWLTFHKEATRADAAIICDLEDAVLASPVTSQLRDAMKSYVLAVNSSVDTIFTGVQADLEKGDYLSIDGVPLNKMPVYVEEGEHIDYQSSKSCVALAHKNQVMKFVKCTNKLPFVCFRKRYSAVVVGCGTLDPEYKYEERSGSCYKFHYKVDTWSKAYTKCRQENGHLAIGNSKIENTVLQDIFARNLANIKNYSKYNTEQAYVGIRDWLDGDSWKTVKGETLEEAGFSGWDKDQPNNQRGDQHCVTIIEYGTYNDFSCYWQLPFICEKKPEILIK